MGFEMGMYDTVKFLGPEYPVLCAEGHQVKDAFQTKSFDCALDTYFIHENFLYQRKCNKTVEKDNVVSVDGINLIITSTENIPANLFSGIVEVYTHCTQCKPILFSRKNSVLLGMFGGLIDRRFPFITYKLSFISGGKLVKTEPLKNESRNDVVKDLKENGLLVFSDEESALLNKLENKISDIDD